MTRPHTLPVARRSLFRLSAGMMAGSATLVFAVLLTGGSVSGALFSRAGTQAAARRSYGAVSSRRYSRQRYSVSSHRYAVSPYRYAVPSNRRAGNISPTVNPEMISRSGRAGLSRSVSSQRRLTAVSLHGSYAARYGLYRPSYRRYYYRPRYYSYGLYGYGYYRTLPYGSLYYPRYYSYYGSYYGYRPYYSPFYRPFYPYVPRFSLYGYRGYYQPFIFGAYPLARPPIASYTYGYYGGYPRVWVGAAWYRRPWVYGSSYPAPCCGAMYRPYRVSPPGCCPAPLSCCGYAAGRFATYGYGCAPY